MSGAIDVARQAPPANFALEQAVLGALLLNNAVYAELGESLRAEHFADPLHGRIWDEAVRLIERNLVADCRTLQSFFAHDDTLIAAGRPHYLAELAAAAIGLSDTADYARQIVELAQRRRVMSFCLAYHAEAAGMTPRTPAAALLETMESELFAIREGGAAPGPQPLASALGVAVDNAQKAWRRGGVIGVGSGLADLDRLLGGFADGELVIVGARPKMGKTTLLRTILENAAGYHRPGDSAAVPVALMSMEMGADEIARQGIARHAGISAHRQRTGRLGAADWPKIVAAQAHLARLPIYIDAAPRQTPATLLARLRRLRHRHGIRLAGVDYLQLMGAGDSRKSRYEEITEISRALKVIAKELGMPLLVLSQLSRAVEQREDKRPGPEDLRDSGSIEQDANAVLFIYRDDYYAAREEPQPRAGEDSARFAARHADWQARCAASRGQAELIVALSRAGPAGTVRLAYDGERSCFADLPAPAGL